MKTVAQIIEEKATEVTAADGLQILEITDHDTAREIIEGLGNQDTRKKVLRLLESNNKLLKLAGNPQNPFPSTFSAQLTSVPNRGEAYGKPAREDTSQQETEFGSAKKIRMEVVKLLLDENSAVAKTLERGNNVESDWIKDFNRRLILEGEDADIGKAILAITPLALEQSLFADLVTEMQGITRSIPHLRQRWGKEAAGTFIVNPEQKMDHRRNGLVSGQVVWHADNNGGIIFCQDKDMQHPKRMLFKEDGTVI